VGKGQYLGTDSLEQVSRSYPSWSHNSLVAAPRCEHTPRELVLSQLEEIYEFIMWKYEISIMIDYCIFVGLTLVILLCVYVIYLFIYVCGCKCS
jgi:hypothetical protein